MNYTFIKSLIDLAAEYEESTGSSSAGIAEFIEWIRNGQPASPLMDVASTPEGYSDSHVAGMISKLLVYMYRYAKLYIKKGLEGTPIQSMDEFGYMVSLLQHGPMNKTSLIQRNIQEKPTGMEIINRMIKLKLMAEMPDPNDKRSKLLYVSDDGRKVMGSLFMNMDKISKLILADLSMQEQLQFMNMLQRLDDFHKPIFNDNLAKVEELLKNP
ncbi:DNA-binding transcriptional regulator, MarR family [Chitinophaga jiangningensis]|uniref:DNA-binding transcriptional regulator, MarR family n=1 Tax=Chitinophaga jiangningensis TaxID=1419482 RepID=A0A1M7A624_9BACT|nr:MarR family winged helix-turn-helix transcriptional regulator [Chitinophaga jiangningensis]SHL38170.1 DNA-binding transcriptional regulator, MarR family [Chitinophaga jiangningensis]